MAGKDRFNLCLVLFLAIFACGMAQLIEYDEAIIDDNDTIQFVDFDAERNVEDGQNQLPPPGLEILTNSIGGRFGGSCSCKQVLVSSLGETQHIQPDSLGIYKYYQMYNGYPSYYGNHGRRLYFLAGSGWLIGSSLGAGAGFIHNAASYQCPYLIQGGLGNWQYVNHGYWYKDDTLIVRCIQ